MDDVPLRIGDADRDRAVERLRAAMAEGRLTYDEFDERLGVALGAKYESDLEPLFADLPPVEEPNPAASSTSRSLQLGPFESGDQLSVRHYVARRNRFYGAVWPMALFLMVASGFRLWWLVLVPIVLGPILAGAQRPPRHHHQLPPGRR
ncbi:MAG: DUF1707 domain-containing protein [Propionibacterium sp.]|nr:DUF1707 domain-containing protein [Propionibacterium sp.]